MCIKNLENNNENNNILGNKNNKFSNNKWENTDYIFDNLKCYCIYSNKNCIWEIEGLPYEVLPDTQLGIIKNKWNYVSSIVINYLLKLSKNLEGLLITSQYEYCFIKTSPHNSISSQYCYGNLTNIVSHKGYKLYENLLE
jgi:hypothetical protein